MEEKFSPIVERIHELAKEFHTSKKFYFYDSGTGKVIECGEVIYCCMKRWRETKEYSTIFELGFSREEIVKELYELWKIVQEEHVLQAIPVEQFYIPEKLENYISENVEMLILELTERCNLRCKYCIYQEDNKSYRTYGEKEMTLDIAKKAIDFLVSHSVAVDKETKLKLTFYGGEPLLKFDLIKECVEYAKIVSPDRQWFFSMTSNLTLLTDEMCEWFAKNKFAITVSLDGDQETHDSQRVFPNGNGSFEIVVRNMKKLVLLYEEQDRHLISINSVITPPYDTEKMNRMQNFFSELVWLPEQLHHTWTYAQSGSSQNVEDLQLAIYRNETADASELDPVTQWHYRNVLSNQEKPLFTGNDEVRVLQDIQERRIIEKPSSIASLNACCVPGVRRIYTTTDGRFNVCERIGFSPDIGNVETGIDYSLVKKYYIDQYTENSIKDCKHCWAVNLCAVCYAYCYDEQGLNMDTKRAVCSRVRFLKEQALIHYHELLEQAPEYLEKLLAIPKE